MVKQLTADLVLMRSKADKLTNVKNLNLWGNELEDVAILKDMTNVQILSLSLNKISSLKDFGHCKHLTELYLRKNRISDLREVKYLASLPYLRVLWLWDNPIAEHELYRLYIIKTLPNLDKLDNNAVTPEERAQANALNIQDDEMPPPPPQEQPPPPKEKAPTKGPHLMQEVYY